MALSSGTRLGPYEILSPLGAGGMGEVYRARDTRLERDVAVKVLPENLIADADALARFEREAKAVAALSHPNILAIHDFGRDRGIAYAVMELLEGETLRERLGAAPLLLLDDPFAELDVRRSARILELLAEQGMGQTLLTVPRETDIPPALTQLTRWSIESGVVRTDDGVRRGAA